MVESFIITFRETLEAALLVGIVFVYLKKTKKDHLNPYMYGGVLLAVVASVIGAIILQILYQGQETRGQQLFEGTIMLTAALFVTTMVIWMWKVGRNIKKNILHAIDRSTENSATDIRAGLGVLLFIFLMVFREGAETVLFFYASAFRSGFLSNLAGGVFGIVFASIFGFLVMKGSSLIDLKKFFTVTGALLLFIVVELIATAIHEFQEARLLLPASTGIFWDIQIWLASPASSLITLLPLVLIPSAMIVFSVRNKEDIAQQEIRSNILTKFFAGALTIFMVLLTFSQVAAQEPGYDPVPVRIDTIQNEIRIPITTISERMTKYIYKINDVDVRFLLVKASDGTIKSALDACRICGPMGFEQFEDTVVCERCGVETEIDDIGEDVGCNPIPLESFVDNGDIVIPVAHFLKDMYIWTDY